MPTQAGDIIRVAARHLFNGVDEQVCVHHFNVSTAPGSPNDALLLIDISALLSSAYDNIKTDMPTLVSAADIAVYNVIDDYPLGVVNWTSPYAGGTSVGDSLPPQTSFMALWRTATKRVLGKTYLPTFTEATQSGGTISGAAFSDIANFIDALNDPTAQVNGYGFSLVIWSKQAGQARPIVSARPGLRVATQRRRKAGVGS